MKTGAANRYLRLLNLWGGAGPIFHDTFDGPGDLLVNHTPNLNIGCGPWEIVSTSSALIQDGYAASNLTTSFTGVNTNRYNGTISLTAFGTVDFKLMFRASSGANYWVMRHDTDNSVKFTQYVSGTPYIRASGSKARVQGEEMKVIMLDDSIRGYIDGELIISYDGATTRETKHGILHGASYDLREGEFTIWP